MWCLLAAFALGAAIQCQDGEYSPAAIVLLAVAILFSVMAVRARPVPLTRRGVRVAWALAIVGLAGQFVWALLVSPSGQFYWNNDLHLADVRSGSMPLYPELVVACVLIVGAIVARGRLRVGLLIALLALHVGLNAWMIEHTGEPFIDTYVMQKEGGRALLEGRNPYAITFPDIYNSTAPFARRVYGEGLVRDGRVQFGYIYPPLPLILGTAADVAFGDPRYAFALAATLAGALMLLARPSGWAILAAATFLFTPRVFYVTSRAWTDPVVLLVLMIVAWLAARRSRLTPIAFGVLLAAKQYAFILIPAAILLPRERPRSFVKFLAIAVLAGGATLLPFFLWGPQAFLHSTVWSLVASPIREDGLTFFTWCYQLTGRWPPGWVTLVPLIAAWVFVARRRGRSVAGFLAGAALVMLVFFAFNKHAFVNYYFLIIGVLCAGAAVDDGENRKGTGRPAVVLECPGPVGVDRWFACPKKPSSFQSDFVTPQPASSRGRSA